MSPAEAAEAARIEEATSQMIVLMMPFAIMIVGVILGFAMRRKEEEEKFRLLPFLICAGIGVFSLVTHAARPADTSAAASSGVVAAPSGAEIRETSSPVPAGAITVATTPSRAREVERELRRLTEDMLAGSGRRTANVTARVFDMSGHGKIVTRATRRQPKVSCRSGLKGLSTAGTSRSFVTSRIPGRLCSRAVPASGGWRTSSGSWDPFERRRDLGDGFTPARYQ